MGVLYQHIFCSCLLCTRRTHTIFARLIEMILLSEIMYLNKLRAGKEDDRPILESNVHVHRFHLYHIYVMWKRSTTNRLFSRDSRMATTFDQSRGRVCCIYGTQKRLPCTLCLHTMQYVYHIYLLLHVHFS